MLRELSIRNFAIIDDLTVSFFEGLTVLTGETGAGKSIIIDAVNILAGGRGSTEFIRHGEKKAELGGLFQVNNSNHPIFVKLEEHGIEAEEGREGFSQGCDRNKNGRGGYAFQKELYLCCM